MLVDVEFFTTALTVAIQIVAVLEAVKNFVKVKMPTWVFTIISAVLALALSLVTIPAWEWSYISEQLPVALFAFCLAELFYDSLWKWIKAKLEKEKKNGENTCRD